MDSEQSNDKYACIPEYFAKPGVAEALAESHPTRLVRQMANEILRLRCGRGQSVHSAKTPREIAIGAISLYLATYEDAPEHSIGVTERISRAMAMWDELQTSYV